MKKKETNKHLEEELDVFRRENYHLKLENKNLKRERSFLIDQIKFMQNLIRSSNLKSTTSYDIENNNLSIGKTNSTESETSNEGTPVMIGGSKHRPIGRLFNVMIICVLSILYVTSDKTSEGEIIIGGSSSLTLNDIGDKATVRHSNWSLLQKCLFVVILGIISWSVYPIYDYVKKKVIRKKSKLIKNL